MKRTERSTPEQREYAKKRLPELQALETRSFSDPTLVVTNDKHFGNNAAKPRGCVVVGVVDKDRVRVAPIHHRTISTVILDSDFDRQLDPKTRVIDRAEIYETKIIPGIKPLSENDKRKIKHIYSKK